MSSELELFFLIVLFYLYDSSVLLYSNEAVLTRDSRGHWSVAVGWTGFLFAGRALQVLNPFTPHRPSFRLYWNSGSTVVDTTDQSWSEPMAKLTALAPFTLTAGIGLFVVLPLGLFTALGVYADLAGMALFYGATAAALYRVKRLGLLEATDLRRFLGFAFECLACPPFGVNMVRRMALAKKISEPLPLAGARLLDPAAWGQLKQRIGELESRS